MVLVLTVIMMAMWCQYYKLWQCGVGIINVGSVVWYNKRGQCGELRFGASLTWYSERQAWLDHVCSFKCRQNRTW